MTELEVKEKRWKFLNELRRRGVETPHAKRVAWEIMLIKVKIEQEEKRKAELRDYKINQLFD